MADHDELLARADYWLIDHREPKPTTRDWGITYDLISDLRAAVAGWATAECDCDEFPYHACPIHGDGTPDAVGSATPEEDT